MIRGMLVLCILKTATATPIVQLSTTTGIDSLSLPFLKTFYHRLLHHEQVCTADGDECQNGGICILTSSHNDDGGSGGTEHGTTNYCQCPQGVGGTYCQDDACPLTCQHGSSCRHYQDISHGSESGGGTGEGGGSNVESNYFCECVGNYKGQECEVPFVTCPREAVDNDDVGSPLQCLYGGACVASEFDEDPNVYICSCPRGRSGASCENADTQSDNESTSVSATSCLTDDDCQHGGLCVRVHDPHASVESRAFMTKSFCQCPTGWGGEYCEETCPQLDCQYGGSCRFAKDDETHSNNGSVGLAYCECVGQYSGMECEVAFQVCPSSSGTSDGDEDDPLECLYGGSCVGSENDEDPNIYVCECPSSRKGVHCEIPVGSNTGGQQQSQDLTNSGTGSSMSSTTSRSTGFLVFVLLMALLGVALIAALIWCVRRRQRSPQNSRGIDGDIGNGDDTFSPDNGQTKAPNDNDNGDDDDDDPASSSGDWVNKTQPDGGQHRDSTEEHPVAITHATIV